MGLKPIFILGPHKSGTSLLRNLFDGHPDLFVCPVETHFFRLLGRWVDYDLRRSFPQDLSKEEVVDSFTGLIEHLDKQDNALADSNPKGRFDIDAFRSLFQEIEEPLRLENVIHTYFRAIYRSLYGKELQKGHVLHKTVGLAEHALELKKAFPEARFVHIVRNPYANLVAFRKFRTSNGPYPLIDRLLRSLNNNYYFLYKNQELLEDHHTIHYEELVKDPEGSMKDLSDRLDLSFEEILLEPTSMGLPWEGNSSGGEKLRGVDPSVLDRWKKEIHPMEAHYVSRSFSHILRDHGYERLVAPSKSAFLKPAKKESPGRYLYNRVYELYARNMRPTPKRPKR
jgi:hypothetical protein